MRLGATGKAVTNESRYPYIVELIVADDKLDLEVSRRIMDFHRLRKIQVRHGRITPVRAGGGDVAAGVIGGLAAGTIIGAAVAGPRYYGPWNLDPRP
jgi:hypothetical protein